MWFLRSFNFGLETQITILSEKYAEPLAYHFLCRFGEFDDEHRTRYRESATNRTRDLTPMLSLD